MLNDDPLWYKDAIIYELHVKAFFDANDDGIGDFRGLLQKLDYLQQLGITCIWLLPFYPSPQRDDGYDIADYRDVHPTYGMMRDFREFVREAHGRGMRVLTELVINHTSDQHPWFQRARNAPAGSKYRDWYIWSDTDQKFTETRIIFTDTEISNWTWDPVAKAYYWHRFFSHQPDLNFDNPQVVRSVIDVMRFWLDCGVDGLRLDAIPYLIEREGTNNENLPETHVVLKQLRAALDERHTNRMFLAEANQWPEDVQAYFGDGNECHVAYHFPLMPRMYMSIAQEDRHPITDIMRQTPDIPANCQWAIFLRNHDELTLEMVTDSERDYLWNTYAADSRARINLGIRRRLAPLMENDRRKIELMNSLLMSLPGTPIIYYGDEIGMGDNIFLGDRNGVRTPMQWTPDRNGGFSRCDPARLFLPPVMDPVYGFQAINVEAQLHSASSLLNWMRRLIAVRQAHRVFGRGTLTFLYPDNRRILAFLRVHENEVALCVANLSRSAQAFSLDLSQYKGRIPVELLGRTPFPVIREDGYDLSLQGHSFYWFLLHDAASLPSIQQPIAVQPPAYTTLVLGENWTDVLKGRTATILTHDVMPERLPTQRWFRAKDVAIRSVSIAGHAEIVADGQRWLMTLFEAKFGSELKPQLYLVPLALESKEVRLLPPAVQAQAIAKTRRGPREGTLYDAMADDRFVLELVDRVRRGDQVPFENGTLQFKPTAAFEALAKPEHPSVRRIGAEQSNTTVLIEDHLVLKLYRRIEQGIQPEIEIGRYLTDVAKYANTPPLLGSIEIKQASGRTSAVAVMHGFVRNQGDGWVHTLNYLDRYLDDAALKPADQLAAELPETTHAVYLAQVHQLGIRTAELHRALTPTEAPAAFKPEAIDASDIAGWIKRTRNEAAGALTGLRRALKTLPAPAAALAKQLLDQRKKVLEGIGAGIPASLSAMKIRIHGDYHLGQVIVAQNDVYIIDFEGEPRRPVAERRSKESPLRDVAGMLRSFDYAGWAALDQVAQSQPEGGGTVDLERLLSAWRERALGAFLAGYNETIAGNATNPKDATHAAALLRLFLLEKAFYEIQYELANRPAWVVIPLRGVLRTLFPMGER
jgi:maltose alpha-D-glucosyltransferase/alpha-amylase